MDDTFISAYIQFKADRVWDSSRSLDWNFDNLAAHLVEKHNIHVTGGQCKSRFYRFKRKWHNFCQLRGLSRSPETGIGWDAENDCFTANPEHWAALEAHSAAYADFKQPGSCHLYELATETLRGTSATGNRAQSASQPVVVDQTRTARASSSRSRKGKQVASSSIDDPTTNFPFLDEDVQYMPSAARIDIGRGKRPATSHGASGEPEGSRSMKSPRSSGERFDDAISKLNSFSSCALEDRQSRRQRDCQFSVEVAQDIVNGMALPDEWKLEACFFFAERGNEGQRVIFIRFDDAQRYAYITRLMRQKGIA